MNNKKKGPLKLKISLKLWKTNGTVKRWHTAKIRRIYAILKAEKFLKAYLKVVYGRGCTNNGRIEEIYNDGQYQSVEELRQALTAFTEKSLLDDTNAWTGEGKGV